MVLTGAPLVSGVHCAPRPLSGLHKTVYSTQPLPRTSAPTASSSKTPSRAPPGMGRYSPIGPICLNAFISSNANNPLKPPSYAHWLSFHSSLVSSSSSPAPSVSPSQPSICSLASSLPSPTPPPAPLLPVTGFYATCS